MTDRKQITGLPQLDKFNPGDQLIVRDQSSGSDKRFPAGSSVNYSFEDLVNSINNSNIYADTTAGLAGTSDGDYFVTPSANAEEYLILYLNDAGTAVEQSRYPSAQGIAISLAGIGYEFIGDYAAGIEVTAYNQVIRESGEFWRLSGSESLPYTTTGAGMPEGGSFVNIGDAVLRQELDSNTAGQGSDLVSHAGTDDTVTEALDKLFFSPIIEASSNITLSPDQSQTIVLCNASGGAFNVELPAHSEGFTCTIIKIAGADDVSIKRNGSAVNEARLRGPQNAIRLVSDGTSWLRPDTTVHGDINALSADPSFTVARTVTGDGSGNAHGYVLEDSIQIDQAAGAYAGFDANFDANGNATSLDHMNAFQSRIVYNGSATLDHLRGLRIVNFVGTGATVGAWEGISIEPGANNGDITLQVGLDIRGIEQGSNNYAIRANKGTWWNQDDGILIGGPANAAATAPLDIKKATNDKFAADDYAIKVDEGTVWIQDGAILVGGTAGTVPAFAFEVDLSSGSHPDYDANLMRLTGDSGGMLYARNASADVVSLLAGSGDTLVIGNGSVDALEVATDGGLVGNGATGGTQGVGTANFRSVYDDGTILTDYVFDKYLGGESFDYSEAVLEKSLALESEWFEPGKYAEFWRENRRLPGMPDVNDVVDGKLKVGHGDLIQRLMQTVELQAIHIEELRQRIDGLGT